MHIAPLSAYNSKPNTLTLTVSFALIILITLLPGWMSIVKPGLILTAILKAGSARFCTRTSLTRKACSRTPPLQNIVILLKDCPSLVQMILLQKRPLKNQPPMLLVLLMLLMEARVEAQNSHGDPCTNQCQQVLL